MQAYTGSNPRRLHGDQRDELSSNSLDIYAESISQGRPKATRATQNASRKSSGGGKNKDVSGGDLLDILKLQ